MSENKEQKVHRPVSEIQREYQSLCTKAGHMSYQIFALRKDLEAVNETLRDLNFEAAASKEAEDKKAKEEAATEPKKEETK